MQTNVDYLFPMDITLCNIYHIFMKSAFGSHTTWHIFCVTTIKHMCINMLV